jgi:hypothetical protein
MRLGLVGSLGILGLVPAILSGPAPRQVKVRVPLHSGGESRVCGFAAVTDFANWTRTATEAGTDTLVSPEIALPLPANEIVVSWNADAPAGTGLELEARAVAPAHTTRWYSLGRWSRDGETFPRESVPGQKDADGDVDTDTLMLTQRATKLQIQVIRRWTEPAHAPDLRFVGVSLMDTTAHAQPLHPNHAAWGREVAVPARTQLGWPGGRGWCSPTSTDMALAFWSRKLGRPELDMPVPEVAHAIYDKVYEGTGNWPFNTAFAGSFPGMRAYVTRFRDIRELEDWVVAGIPPVVSVSYAVLKATPSDNDPGHLMVCDGFTSTGDIVLNDPAFHADRGERCRRVFSRDNFLKAWARSRNTVYLIYPEGAKIPANRYGDWEQTK